MYDEAVLGSIDDFEELAETLLDHEENWHMGSDKDEAWKKAVLANIPNLLSVGHDVDNVSQWFYTWVCPLANLSEGS